MNKSPKKQKRGGELNRPKKATLSKKAKAKSLKTQKKKNKKTNSEKKKKLSSLRKVGKKPKKSKKSKEQKDTPNTKVQNLFLKKKKKKIKKTKKEEKINEYIQVFEKKLGDTRELIQSKLDSYSESLSQIVNSRVSGLESLLQEKTAAYVEHDIYNPSSSTSTIDKNELLQIGDPKIKESENRPMNFPKKKKPQRRSSEMVRINSQFQDLQKLFLERNPKGFEMDDKVISPIIKEKPSEEGAGRASKETPENKVEYLTPNLNLKNRPRKTSIYCNEKLVVEFEEDGKHASKNLKINIYSSNSSQKNSITSEDKLGVLTFKKPNNSEVEDPSMNKEHKEYFKRRDLFFKTTMNSVYDNLNQTSLKIEAFNLSQSCLTSSNIKVSSRTINRLSQNSFLDTSKVSNLIAPSRKQISMVSNLESSRRFLKKQITTKSFKDIQMNDLGKNKQRLCLNALLSKNKVKDSASTLKEKTVLIKKKSMSIKQKKFDTNENSDRIVSKSKSKEKTLNFHLDLTKKSESRDFKINENKNFTKKSLNNYSVNDFEIEQINSKAISVKEMQQFLFSDLSNFKKNQIMHDFYYLEINSCFLDFFKLLIIFLNKIDKLQFQFYKIHGEDFFTRIFYKFAMKSTNLIQNKSFDKILRFLGITADKSINHILWIYLKSIRIKDGEFTKRKDCIFEATTMTYNEFRNLFISRRIKMALVSLGKKHHSVIQEFDPNTFGNEVILLRKIIALQVDLILRIRPIVGKIKKFDLDLVIKYLSEFNFNSEHSERKDFDKENEKNKDEEHTVKKSNFRRSLQAKLKKKSNSLLCSESVPLQKKLNNQSLNSSKFLNSKAILNRESSKSMCYFLLFELIW